jgi:hypothetical protein
MCFWSGLGKPLLYLEVSIMPAGRNIGFGALVFLALLWTSSSAVGQVYQDENSSNYTSSGMKESTFDELTRYGAESNAKLGPEWKAVRSETTGRVRVLYGSGGAPYKGSSKKAALSCVGDLKDVLGLSQDDDFTVVKVGKSMGKVHLRLQQTFRGVKVEGGQILVHITPEGSVTMVQNGSFALNFPNNESLIPKEKAEDDTRALLRTKLGTHAFMGDKSSELVIIPFKGEYLYVWKISIPTDNPLGLWVTYINAESGEVLRQYNSIMSLKKGKGNVFLTNSDASQGNYTTTTLKNLLTELEMPGAWIYGCPIGKNIFVGRSDGSDIYFGSAFSLEHKFLYDPTVDSDAFDEVQTYYHFDKTHKWWSKKVIQDEKNGWVIPYFNDGYVPPAVVNRTGDCNAYYTSMLPHWNTPGFAFYDEGECLGYGFNNRDFTHDAGIIYHEFTHGVSHWTGTPFNGMLDEYPRAMGEGNADYFACSKRNNPLIGEVIDPSGSMLRDISGAATSQRLYPDDVDYPILGTPEEHYTGEIWGQVLWDLRAKLKKKADRYIQKTNAFYLVNGGGHFSTDVDFYDWVSAFLAMLSDSTPYGAGTTGAKASKTFSKCYSVFADRGIFTRTPYSHNTDYFYSSAPGSDNEAWYYYNFNQSGKWKHKGNLHTSNSNPSTGNPSEYFFRVNISPNRVAVKLKSVGTDLREPAIVLRNALSGTTYTPVETVDTDYTCYAEFTGLPPSTTLVVEVYSATGDTGQYKLQIKAK